MQIVKLALTVFLTGGEVTNFFLLTRVKHNVEPYYNAAMIIFKKSVDLQSHLNKAKHSTVSLGFVPTMGALHAGHLSLLSQSKKNCGLTVCSIFVNPVQFNNKEDFIKYPATIEKDILLLEENGCDILFMPSVEEIYPDEASMHKRFELGNIEYILEGKFRPGHFQGVCLVVEKLINIIDPDCLFLGQKDYQQCLVLKKLVSLMHKNIDIVICPILREKNGLAMSSRNLRLNEDERKTAGQLYATLNKLKENFNGEDFILLKNESIAYLNNIGFKVDYLELAKMNDLEIINDCNNPRECIILSAAILNNVRLIDNVVLKN